MHKADELAVNITFLLYINTTGFTNEVCIPHYIVRALKANRTTANSTNYIKHSDYSQRLVSCEWN
jgi:hypothetical protein